MRRAWSANSVSVITDRSGAPTATAEATEPAYMPNSNPNRSAMRAEMGSKTEAGWMHPPSFRCRRNRSLRS